MKLELAVIVLLAARAGLAAAGPEEKVFPGKEMRKAEISTETGAISVGLSAGADAEVAVTGNDPEKCALTIRLEGGVLLLKAEKKRKFFGENCPAGFAVKLPAGIPLKAASGTGAMEISGLSGDVKVKSGTGGLAVKGLSGALAAELGTGSVSGTLSSQDIRIKTGTGSVGLSGLRGGASIETGNGSVDLRWGGAPSSAAVKVVAGMGSITLRFPAETKVSAELKPAMGNPVNEFPSASGGVKVSASSGMGGISLLKIYK